VLSTRPGPQIKIKIAKLTKDCLSIKVPKDSTANIIHAGLETAYAVQKVPEMDCISIGPTITNPHSGEESICVDTVPVFYDIVKTIITEYYTK
jgi:dipeptidase D